MPIMIESCSLSVKFWNMFSDNFSWVQNDVSDFRQTIFITLVKLLIGKVVPFLLAKKLLRLMLRTVVASMA